MIMLRTVTFSNKCFIPDLDVVYIAKEGEDVKLSNSVIGPIRLSPRKYSVNKILGNNDLAVTIDGKQHICSNLNALFSPGKTPVKISIDNLEEVSWEGEEVPVQKETITLEIGAETPTTDAALTGWDLGPVKINGNVVPSIESIELFTECTILKAKVIFAVNHIKFTGVNVETEANYYVKPD